MTAPIRCVDTETPGLREAAERLEIASASAPPPSDRHVVVARPHASELRADQAHLSGRHAVDLSVEPSALGETDPGAGHTRATHALTLVQLWAYAIDQLGLRARDVARRREFKTVVAAATEHVS